METHKLNTY